MEVKVKSPSFMGVEGAGLNSLVGPLGISAGT